MRAGTRWSPANVCIAIPMSPRPPKHAGSRCVMQPSLRDIEAGLRRTTEALASTLAAGEIDGGTSHWTALDWRLAEAAAAAHGVSSLLGELHGWNRPDWQAFLLDQRAHIEARHRRIETLLECIDDSARVAGLAFIVLK